MVVAAPVDPAALVEYVFDHDHWDTSKEILRFAVNSSTAFPASQIQELIWEPGSAPVMVVNFMGLTGPLGVPHK